MHPGTRIYRFADAVHGLYLNRDPRNAIPFVLLKYACKFYGNPGELAFGIPDTLRGLGVAVSIKIPLQCGSSKHT